MKLKVWGWYMPKTTKTGVITNFKRTGKAIELFLFLIQVALFIEPKMTV